MDRLSERLAVVATIDPDAYGTSNQDSDVIDMSLRDRVLFVVTAGTIATNGVLNFKVYGDTASNGSFTTQITGKQITPLTEAGTDSDKQALVEVSGEEVRAQGFRYIRGQLQITVAGADAGVVVLGANAHYYPDTDLTTVDEIVA